MPCEYPTCRTALSQDAALRRGRDDIAAAGTRCKHRDGAPQMPSDTHVTQIDA
jgi:hypothetical protein